MSQAATPAIWFAVPATLPLDASFDKVGLVSDGGLAELAENNKST